MQHTTQVINMTWIIEHNINSGTLFIFVSGDCSCCKSSIHSFGQFQLLTSLTCSNWTVMPRLQHKCLPNDTPLNEYLPQSFFLAMKLQIWMDHVLDLASGIRLTRVRWRVIKRDYGTSKFC